MDRFKAFNDTHGHPAGDQAVATVGSVLRDTSRSFHIIGRIRNDEFAIIFQEPTPPALN